MSKEIEIRRQLRLTSELRKLIRSMWKDPIKIEFMICYEQNRVFINQNPRIERKTLEFSRPLLLDKIYLEICYDSIETNETIDKLTDALKYGILVRKTTYVQLHLLTMYTLEYLETTELYDKCVLELEQPNKASDYIKQLYRALAFLLRLKNEFKSLQYSLENVIHDYSIKYNGKSYPKVDGERGILMFFDGYEVFSSNTESLIIKPPLQNQWPETVSFFLRKIPLVVEHVKMKNKNCFVLIDLALSKYFNASIRMEFVIKLASIIRVNICANPAFLFQVYDEIYIRDNINIDGEIFIFNDKLYKHKSIKTVDLKYNNSLNGMSDRDGGFYDLEVNVLNSLINLKLEDGFIYECILDNNSRKVTRILRQRLDKFYPNSMLTVSGIYSFKVLNRF